ncbi:hypothetical protein FUAX_18510 [Fulvitalea axinellae]|uniref:FAS1 domain-containing protein n=1 Tax=Fulvitalea axinellae TaxID=1182444 RepID=A0AAU9CBD4_9BACT|nr:hypothetical protein FUAX_18510 [Fulvitalea axinellae]
MRLCLRIFKGAFVLVVLILYGCQDRFEDYKVSGSLSGRLVTAMEEVEEGDLSQFVKGIDILNMRDDLEKSTYTVFPPTDDAVFKYLKDKFGVSDISEIPEEEVKKIVRGHIIRDAWSWDQLLIANNSGWGKKPGDPGYGLKADWNFKFKSIYNAKPYEVTDKKTGKTYKLSRETDYLPIFDFEPESGIKEEEDYTFLFPDSEFTGYNIHAAISTRPNQKTLNGYFHVIDRVIPPLGNLEMLLAESKDFTVFYDILNRFSKYSYDEKSTLAQKGEVKDSLYDKYYNSKYVDFVAFDVNPKNAYSHWYTEKVNNVATIPSDEALNAFLDETFIEPGYFGSVDDIPNEALWPLIMNHTQFARYTVMQWLRPSDLDYFTTGNKEFASIDKDEVFFTAFLNNAVVYGINRTLAPRGYASVMRKLSLDSKYSMMLRLMNRNETVATLMNAQGITSTVLAPSDDAFEAAGYTFDEKANKFMWFDPDKGKDVEVSSTMLDRIFISHMLYDVDLQDFTSRSFIQNMDGESRIRVQDGKLYSGGNYEIDEQKAVEVVATDKGGDNGTFYEISDLLLPPRFSVNHYLTDPSRHEYEEFVKLLEKAGLIKNSIFKSVVLLAGEGPFTVIVPSNAVILANKDKIPEDPDELRDFLSYYFIQEEALFSENNINDEFLTLSETAAKDVFRKIKVSTENGTLGFTDLKGGKAKVIEDVRYSNILAYRGTIHLIDNLLWIK